MTYYLVEIKICHNFCEKYCENFRWREFSTARKSVCETIQSQKFHREYLIFENFRPREFSVRENSIARILVSRESNREKIQFEIIQPRENSIRENPTGWTGGVEGELRIWISDY